MNAISTIEAEDLHQEIAGVALSQSSLAERRERWIAARWFNNLPIARKLGILVGGLMCGLTMTTVEAVAAYAGVISGQAAIVLIVYTAGGAPTGSSSNVPSNVSVGTMASTIDPVPGPPANTFNCPVRSTK